jgi:hypothetical protein
MHSRTMPQRGPRAMRAGRKEAELQETPTLMAADGTAVYGRARAARRAGGLRAERPDPLTRGRRRPTRGTSSAARSACSP